MKIELMIYVYIAICISMIAFNIVYVFVLRHLEKALDTNSQKLKKIIFEQIEVIKNGKEISEKHIKYLCKKLLPTGEWGYVRNIQIQRLQRTFKRGAQLRRRGGTREIDF